MNMSGKERCILFSCSKSRNQKYKVFASFFLKRILLVPKKSLGKIVAKSFSLLRRFKKRFPPIPQHYSFCVFVQMCILLQCE